MRAFLAAWLAVWVVVGIGALRAMSGLWKVTSGDHDEPTREAVQVAATRARRWAYVMAGMGLVAAVVALVSPWL